MELRLSGALTLSRLESSPQPTKPIKNRLEPSARALIRKEEILKTEDEDNNSESLCRGGGLWSLGVKCL